MKSIHDDIEDWHTDPLPGGHVPLHMYLGMPHNVYVAWFERRLTNDELAWYGYYDSE